MFWLAIPMRLLAVVPVQAQRHGLIFMFRYFQADDPGLSAPNRVTARA
ncbi:MAG: hypothetical protein LBQ32_02570 [Burkholderiaceae bacterium]|jgi:hypothetical protein|nr:hypothetical protein [Burkholderiaceae bacterium]